MDYQAALNKLKTLEVEGVADLVSAIEGKVSSLESKNFEVIGEKRNATQRQAALTEALEAIGRGLNLTGGVDELLEQLPGKVQDLRRDKDSLQQKFDETAGKLSQVEGEAQSLKRKTKLQEIAAKTGASTVVLERLFADQIDNFTIAEDGAVKLGDRPLRECVEADENLKVFIPALFPGGAADKPKQQLPNGSPGGTPEKKDPVKAALSTLKFAVPGSTQ